MFSVSLTLKLLTYNADYGPMVNRSARVESKPCGGQIFISSSVMKELEKGIISTCGIVAKRGVLGANMRLATDSVPHQTPSSPLVPIYPNHSIEPLSSTRRPSSVSSIQRLSQRRRSSISKAGWRPEALAYEGEDVFECAGTSNDELITALKTFGIHTWLIGEIKLKGMEMPETIFAVSFIHLICKR